MRHVDEGTIHAWLDGQVTDPAEAAWLETHVGACTTCGARLADARATAAQADALLAAAAPVAERPAFDALVTRAREEAPQPVGVASSLRLRAWSLPVAWAASLVLAVALGWSIREGAGRDAAAPGSEPMTLGRARETSPAAVSESVNRIAAPGRRQIPEPPAAPVVPSPTAEASREASRNDTSGATLRSAPADAARSETPAGASEAPTPSPGSLVAPAAVAPPAAAPPPVPAMASERAEVPPPAQSAAAAEARPLTGDGVAIESPVRTARRLATGNAVTPAKAAAPSLAAAPVVDVQTARVAAREGRGAGQSPWRTVPRTEAAARSGMPLYGIEGLAPTATMLSVDERTVRTTYRLATGQSVEVVQQRLGERPDPASAPGPLADPGGVAGVADQPVWSTRRGDLQLTIRGMTAAQLAALGDQLRLD